MTFVYTPDERTLLRHSYNDATRIAGMIRADRIPDKRQINLSSISSKKESELDELVLTTEALNETVDRILRDSNR